jgi:ketosteroid isomerase-like protein
MHTLLLALALTTLGTHASASPQDSAVLRPINQFIDAFNKGDQKTAAALCSDITSIVDELPPYEWHGAGACAAWMSAWDADAKVKGITAASVVAASPRHLDVSGNRAYVVLPVTYTTTMATKTEKETASALILTLEKRAQGWRIIAWAWSKG